MMSWQSLASTKGRTPGFCFGLFALAVMLPSLGAGCLWHHHFATFDGPEHLGFTSPTLRARVEPTTGYESKNYCCLWGATTCSPPYSMDFDSEEPTGEVVEFVITELQITYHAEDEVIRPAQLPATARYEDKSYGPPDDRTRVFRAELTFASLIERDESFTLLLRGYYLMKDGSRRPFESNGYFEMTKKNEFTSMWVEMMSV